MESYGIPWDPIAFYGISIYSMGFYGIPENSIESNGIITKCSFRVVDWRFCVGSRDPVSPKHDSVLECELPGAAGRCWALLAGCWALLAAADSAPWNQECVTESVIPRRHMAFLA